MQFLGPSGETISLTLKYFTLPNIDPAISGVEGWKTTFHCGIHRVYVNWDGISGKKNSFFQWSPPWNTILTVSDKPSGSIYGTYGYILAYILTFFLACYLASILTFYLVFIQALIRALFISNFDIFSGVWLRSGTALRSGTPGWWLAVPKQLW